MLEHCDTLILSIDKIYASDGTLVRESPMYKSLLELTQGINFKNTTLFKYYEQYLNNNIHPTRIFGIETTKDIENRLYLLQKLCDEIKAYGFTNVPMVEVTIDDLGRFITWEGNNRLSVCLFLGIQEINVRIVGRAKKWIDFKQQLYNEYGKQILYNPITHPDFCNWPLVNQPIRWSWIRNSIDKYLSIKTDILKPCTDDFSNNGFIKNDGEVIHKTAIDLGCHYGYFSHNLANMNYVVTGVEHNTTYCNGAKYLNYHNNHFVDFINTDICDYIEKTNNKYDIILLLNVLYHILKNSDHSLLLLKKIGEITNLFFTDYTPTDNEMNIEEYIDFLKDVTGFKICEKLGTNIVEGRVLLVLTNIIQ